jgi:hypothetical protein
MMFCLRVTFVELYEKSSSKMPVFIQVGYSLLISYPAIA